MKKLTILILITFSISLFAHSGRTDANGGHYNRKTGEYHYHNGGSSSKSNTTPPPAPAKKAETMSNIYGKVVSISDGDTLTVLQGNTQYKIRLNGIDCPEKSQAYGTKAKEFTSDLVFGKVVTVNIKEKDRYGRYVADIILEDGTVLNSELVRNGFAWHYKQYSDDSSLAELEDAAKSQGVGLWADNSPTPPWEFRKEK